MEYPRNTIRRYEQLGVYSISLNLVKVSYELAKSLPAEEKYALADQLKRAAISVVLNIVEGSGRGTKADFRRFVRQAVGSVLEVDAIGKVGVALSFWSSDQTRGLHDLAESLYFKLLGLEKSLKNR